MEMLLMAPPSPYSRLQPWCCAPWPCTAPSAGHRADGLSHLLYGHHLGRRSTPGTL